MVDEAIPLHSVAFVIRVTGTVVGFALISGRFQVQGRDCVVIFGDDRTWIH